MLDKDCVVKITTVIAVDEEFIEANIFWREIKMKFIWFTIKIVRKSEQWSLRDWNW